MIWSRVAQGYMAAFQSVLEDRSRNPRRIFTGHTLDKRPPELPVLNLNHLRRMTDGTGLLQHATFTVPNCVEGYTTDDNARALLASVLLEELGENAFRAADDLATRYLGFLGFAFNADLGRFRNFLSYDRHWLEEKGSEDSHGRALQALGTVIGRSNQPGLRGAAELLFEGALPAVEDFGSVRGWAYSLLGIQEYLQRFAGDRVAEGLRDELTERLLKHFLKTASSDWPWFEDRLTYANALLPHALLVSGNALGRTDMVEPALEALTWLARMQTDGLAHFVPVGTNGFYERGGERARFDQQPLEAYSMVSACLAAESVTSDPAWAAQAQVAFDWFLGRNDLGLWLYDPVTGGCQDGLHPDRQNQNEGAESTLAFLLALLEIRLAQTIAPGVENLGLARALERKKVPVTAMRAGPY
jgi:hypothetical protein